MTTTFYDLLGVTESATTSEIETAYREAIKQVHPDVSDDVDAGERTKRLNEAKRVLADEEERRRYDRVGHEAYTDGSVTGTTGGSPGRGQDSGTGSANPGAGRDSSNSSDRRSDRRRYRRQSWSEADDHRSTTERTNRGVSGGRRKRGAGRRRRNGDSPGASPSETSEPGPDGWDPGTDRTGPSRASSGPTWQSASGGTAAAGGSTTGSPSARRQAAAGTTDGPNADWSWNSWEQTRSWAVRQSSSSHSGLHPEQLFPAEQSVVLLGSTFLLYPYFIASILFPPFPLVARVAVGLCAMLMFAYLLSVPRIAIVVYGLWSLLCPVALVVIPGVSLFSFAGVVGLSATWVPLALSVLALSVLQG